jgi:hypothetical protein
VKLPRLRRGLRLQAGQLTDALREACLLAGFVVFVRGAWLVWPPAAWLIAGLILIWLGIPPKRRE